MTTKGHSTHLLAGIGLALLTACGQDAPPPASPPPPPSAVILGQSPDLAVFEGHDVTLWVYATGSAGLAYQWKRNGQAVEGATGFQYRFKASLADDGDRFSVAVTNAGAPPVESAEARLTVYPPLDLRFKWVDAPYLPLFSEHHLVADAILSFYDTTLTSPYATQCDASLHTCAWNFMAAPNTSTMTTCFRAFRPSLYSTYYGNLEDGLRPDQLITSLDLEEGADSMAWVSSQTTQIGEFLPAVEGSVALGGLQATATSEGSQGRVITAVSFHSSGDVKFISYGWSEARGTTYQARVVATTAADAGYEAMALGAEGYVVTAMGSGELGAYGVVLVGTRAQGATPQPRTTVLIADVADAAASVMPGFAIVGVIPPPQAGGLPVLIGQR